MHWLPLTLLCAFSLLFGIVYGWLLFREPHLRQRLLAGGRMVAGVAAIVQSAWGGGLKAPRRATISPNGRVSRQFLERTGVLQWQVLARVITNHWRS